MGISRLGQLARRIWYGLRRRFFPRRVYRKAPLRVRPPRAAAIEASPRGLTWRQCLRTVEVEDAAPFAASLFRRRFGKAMPASPRHHVLFYHPDGDATRRVTVGYIHAQAVDDLYLAGGLCIDERAYRAFPKWLFGQVRDEGGLATILTRESVALLTEGAAVIGYIGDLRSRQSSLRAGFVDTDHDHLMVFWRRPVTDAEGKRLIALAATHAPF